MAMFSFQFQFSISILFGYQSTMRSEQVMNGFGYTAGYSERVLRPR